MSDPNLHTTDIRVAENLRSGDIVSGVVVQISDDVVMLDISCKNDAYLPKSEIPKDENIQLNDTIDVVVSKIHIADETIVVSRMGAVKKKAFDSLLEYHQKNIPVIGKIVSVQSHGFEVSLPLTLKAFMHFSQAGMNRVIDTESYLGKEFPVLITKIEKRWQTYDVVVSRRECLILDIQEAWSTFSTTHHVGDVISGTVEEIFPTYAHIRSENIIVTVSHEEMSWLNKVSTKRILDVGETVKFKIMEISADEDEYKVIVSIKSMSDDPWLMVNERLQVDDIVEGEVESIKDFGLFVKVKDYYQGLVHISEINWDTYTQTASQYHPKQKVRVKIIAINQDERRLGLSIKQVELSPWEEFVAQNMNKPITSTIKKVYKFGLLCALTSTIEGFLHQSQISWGNKPYKSKEYNVGDKIIVTAIEADNKRRKVQLCFRDDQSNPWDRLIALKKNNDVIEVSVIKKRDIGLIVSVTNEIEGFIHINQIANPAQIPPEALLESFNVGESLQCIIVSISKDTRKIYLSTRLLEKIHTRNTLEKYIIPSNSDPTTTNIADLTINSSE